MSDQLNETRYVLIRTRNKLVSPLSRFPPEVMSEIFVHAVFDPKDSETSTPSSICQHVQLIYHRLQNLLGVCSTWRDIVMARGVLWSIIPIIPDFPTFRHGLSQLRLKRAGGSKLHLAAVVDSSSLGVSSDLAEILTNYGPRFRAINLSSDSRGLIRDTISMLLRHSPLGTLSQLSIQFKYSYNYTRTIPLRSDYVIPHDSQKAFFTNLVGLTAFRISGIPFQWDTIVFPTRLVELQVDQVMLGFDEMLVPFMRALSSASELRDLKLISVKTYRLQGATSDTATPFSVTFPKLQSLHLQDLCFNTLEILLPMITPGSHHLTLYLTEHSLHDNLLIDHNNGGRQKTFLSHVQIPDFYTALGPNPVYTLMISGRPDSDTLWLTGSTFRGLLEAMPTLKTLKMDLWHFDKVVWTDLNRRNIPRLPALENLYLTAATIHNTKGFWGMVASHPLRQVVLGGNVENVRTGEPSYRESLQGSSNIVQWLRTHVPDFHLVDGAYRPPEFYLGEWQLW